MIKIRAKSVIKLHTGYSSLDYEFPKGGSIDEMVKWMVHALTWNHGEEKAREMVSQFVTEAPVKNGQTGGASR